ncbi:MAG: hypothetical protein J6B77_02430, partial [Clostridia bacterium]|nr:hypothetical protein [Clostridia bacterium]
MEQTKKTEAKKPLGTYEKQKRTTIVLLIVAVVLAVCAVVAYYFVNLDKSSFEQGGVRYRVQMKDGEYVLTNAEGYTCEKTSDGYYVTDDGMLMVAVKEDGTYAFYAAVEGLEDGEEVYNRVAQTILIFPYVSRDNLQALTVHNEHGSYTVYRDESGGFRIKGAEDVLATYDPYKFSSLVTSTCGLIAQDKIIDPIVDENGTFSEYGLADSDTYWYVTTAEDKVYKAILGDRTPSGEGFYVQYVACSDPKFNEDGSVISATESPRKAVYIIAPTTIDTSGGTQAFVDKPFHKPLEDLLSPQIVCNMTLSTYFDVHNFILMHGEEAFLAFDYIDIADRAHSELASYPFVMLLQEHKGLKPSSTQVLEALEKFCGTTFTQCVKLNPTTEELVEYGVLTDPVHTYIETDDKNEVTLFCVRKNEDGSYALYDEEMNLCTVLENGNFTTPGGAEIRIDQEKGTGETVTGDGKWEYNYTSPYSIYFNFDVTENGDEYTTEQMVQFSRITDTKSFFAYSPLYGMLVEIPSYELEWLHWTLFDWVDSKLFDINIAFMDYLRLEFPNGEIHDFVMNNTESSQGAVAKITEKKYTDGNGTVYSLKKVDGEYVLTKTSGPAHKHAVDAYFRIEDTKADESKLFVSYFEMPSGGKSEGWFEGKLYVTSDNKYLVCDSESGYFGVVKFAPASSDITVVHNNKDVVNVPIYRQFYQTLAYASIEQEHVLSDAEKEALLSDKDAFQLRVS